MAVSVNGVGVPDADDYYQRIKGESSLVAYFPLTEPLGADKRVLDTHGGRVGTIVGAPSTSAASVPYGDRALTLNGSNQYVSVPYNASLNPASITVEMWVLRTTDTGSTERLYDTGASSKGFRLGINASDKFHIVSGDGAALSESCTSVSSVATGQWYHLAGTHNGTTATIYVNGVAEASAADAYSANTSAASRIGALIADSQFFPGKIAHVAIYNTALTAAQINRHYSAYADAVLQLAPVGYWRLNEPSGTAAVDLGSGGNAGVYTNTPTFGVAGALRSDPAKATSFTSASTEYVNVAYNAALNPAQFTYIGWFKTGTSGATQVIVSSQDADAANLFGAAMYVSTGNKLVGLLGQGTATRIFPLTNDVVNDDVWHFGAMSFDGSTALLYLDGVDRTYLGPYSASYSVNDDGPLRIGAHGNGTTATFDGELQDVAIFDRALSANEIAYLYQLGKAGLTHPIKYVQS